MLERNGNLTVGAYEQVESALENLDVVGKEQTEMRKYVRQLTNEHPNHPDGFVARCPICRQDVMDDAKEQ